MMRLYLFLSLLFFSFSTYGEEGEEDVAVVEEALPRLPSAPEQKRSATFIRELRGIVLVSDPKQMLTGDALKEVEGVTLSNIQVPGNAKTLRRRLSAFLCHEVDQETLDEIKEVISNYYQEVSHPLVLVEIPQQDISAGVIQVVIFESRLGAVRVEGNTWSSSPRLQEYIDLLPNQQIDESRLMKDVYFINRNPFRRVDIVYAPGEKPQTTDVILSVRERRAWRFYAGAENTGVDPVGRGRWYAGFNWGNAFWLGHIMSYQFTSSWNMHRFHAHTGEYTAPLPWKHVFTVYGGYSEVHPKINQSVIRRNDGWSMQVSARYNIPLNITQFLEHEFSVGADFKRTNNTFEFSEDFPLFGRNVNLTQLVVGYTGNYNRRSYRLDFDGDLYWSPGNLFKDQSNSDYESLRPDAKNHWVYFRGSFVYLQRLPKSFSLSLLARGQISSQNLLPSEQFGLGGYDTVRGYEQREVNKDGAILLSGEARSPAFRLLKNIKSQWKVDDAMQFLIFLDYGWGSDHNALPSERKTDYLLGIGPGIRYTIEPYLTARLDWGIKLHKKADFGGGNTMVHFNVTASY